MLNLIIGGMIAVDPKGSKEVQGGGSKVARMQAVSPLVEAGNVYIPCQGWDSEGKPILSRKAREFLDEVSAFPLGEYDDQADACSQVLRRFMYVILPEIIKEQKRYTPQERFDQDIRDEDYREEGYYD
jgi:predicted phage terminase large subunit-like protein